MSKVAISKSKLDSLAVKIAAKSGETLPLTLDEMEDAVDGISGGGANIPVFTVNYPNVTCNMTYAECRVFAIRDDYDTSALLNCSASCVVGFTLSMALCRFTQSSMTYVVYDSDGVPFGEITYSQDGTIALVESTSLLATLNATSNGTYTPSSGQLYNEVIVNVPSSQPTLETIEHVTPTESSQTITPDTGYDALSSVQIDPISSSYVGSGVTRRSSTDLTASGATVTVPAGYYASQASKAVASGTEGTPSATKGSVSNHAVTVTPSVTNGAGYIAGGTHSGTGVSVSASELVSGTLNVDSSGTKDVTNYASASIPAGTAGTPSATKGTVSNHQVSVTPSVTNTTGFISGGTKTGTAVTVSASELVSGSETKTANGTYDVTNLAELVVNVSTGSSKALYTYDGLASRTANSYGATNAKVTVAKAGTYNISYVAIRGSSSGTMGTNLHIGGTAKGNQQTWNNGTYGQYVSYTDQSIAANTDVTIYATSGNNSRTIYVGQLIVKEV